MVLNNGNVSGNHTIDVSKDVYSATEMTFILITLIAFSIASIFGNVLVFVAYYRKKYLQKATNYFILSLAVADLFVAFFVVNVFTMYMILGYWPYNVLNHTGCVVWLVMDYWVFQSSVFGVLLVAADRYLSIVYPLTYPYKKSNFRVKCAIIFNWVASFLLWGPVIISYSFIRGHKEEAITEKICDVGSAKDIIATVIGSVVSFILPVIAMLYFALHSVYILLNMKQWSKKKPHKFPSTVESMEENSAESEYKPAQLPPELQIAMVNQTQEIDIVCGGNTQTAKPNNGEAIERGHSLDTPSPSKLPGIANSGNHKDIKYKSIKKGSFSRAVTISPSNNYEEKTSKSSKKKNKAALTYFQWIATFNLILAITFVINVLPFGVLSVMRAICGDCVTKKWWHFAHIMAYLNSMLNPLCYGFGNKNFQRAFKSILCAQKR